MPNNKSDTIIKVLSLGLGLAVGIVLIAKVCFEMSYDSFYSNVDRIYCIRTGYTQQGKDNDYGQVSGAVAPGFEAEVPGVEAGTRTTHIFDSSVYLDEDGNKLSGTLVAADTNFFKVFNRPVLAGDPVKTLGEWGKVMVSRSFAEKLAKSAGGVTGAEPLSASADRPGRVFAAGRSPGRQTRKAGKAAGDVTGAEPLSTVLGKTIANESQPEVKLTIGGIFEDFPRNGSLDYDILLSMETYSKESTDNWLGNDRYMGYVKLAPGVDPHGLTEAIRKMQEAHQPLDELEQNGTSLHYYLSPFDKMHTSDPQVRSQVLILSIVAALLLVISFLNYILIVISSMVKRSREVGVRKCYGAESKDIYLMLSGEALRDIVLSLVLVGIIIFAGRNIIMNLLGLPFSSMLFPQSIVAIVAVVLLILVASIVIPAQLYMRLPIYQALKNYKESSRTWKLGLLGVQIMTNIFLVVILLVMGSQYRLVTSADLGYNVKGIFYVNTFQSGSGLQKRVIEVLERQSDVAAVASCYGLPYNGSNGDNVYLPEDRSKELFNIADQYEVSEGWFDLMGIDFVEGRAPRDSSEIVVSERFVERIGEFTDWSDGAVGKQVFITGHNFSDRPFTVAGVYKDYVIGNFAALDTRPSALFYGDVNSSFSWMPNIVFKLTSPDNETIIRLTKAINEASEGIELEIRSCEEDVRDAYSEVKKISTAISVGALFAILIALIGLVSFVRNEALRRSKEVAIRKINGATPAEILGIFLSGVLKLSVAMAVVACVAVWFVAKRFLELFAAKVSLSPFYFITGSLAVMAVVAVVIVLCARRISLANPVDSLKNE